MRQMYAILLAAAAVASPAPGGTNYPVPPGGHWKNEHLGNWRPDQPDFGFEFATITSPGNRGVIESERVSPLSSHFFPNIGRVDHVYRISTTEVTASQWEPFFHALLPHYTAAGGSGFNNEFRSEHITLGGPLGWEINPGEERSAVGVSWQFAARYCNWLHNGAPTGADATLEVFQTGAYDMPALGRFVDPTLMPLTHNADAKYWLPTVDEWIKAAHYDPNRYGEGEEGYWSWMGAQNEPLTPGLPWEGGETSTGPDEAFGPVQLRGIPVAAYDVTSPWGLYDTSGQESEWTESPGVLVFLNGEPFIENRYILGSSFTNSALALHDPIDGMLMQYMAGLSLHASGVGFRIASAVPSPGGAGVLLLGVAAALRRRRAAASVTLVATALASSSLAGTTYPVPPGGHWNNEHLGNWRSDQPDFGFEFATITSPGNRGVIESERVHPLSSHFFPNLGRVDHVYRISTTEVTASQWEPFFHAILPHYTAAGGSGFNAEFSSEHISLGGPLGWQINPGAERSAVSVAWQFAARYCNWLHNGAPTGADATLEVFQTGAYDMPALGRFVDPTLMPLTHNADAKYWLPTVDEWIKAAHYDPDRYGEGEEGYWSWQGAQNEQLTPGLPWEGGETSTGPGQAFGDFIERKGIPVAAYDVTSPWGLYDTSGQESEWTESPGALVFLDGQPLIENRYILGSGFEDSSIALTDPIDGMLMLFMTGSPLNSGAPGFRIASAVPSPAGGGVLLLWVVAMSRRR